jgi:AbrB family looped-hinge helix DNA binding protein
MARTKVSSKYQVVIPKEVREQLDIQAGQEMVIIVKGRTMTLIPDRPIASMRGFAKGVRTSGFREKKDRF